MTLYVSAPATSPGFSATIEGTRPRIPAQWRSRWMDRVGGREDVSCSRADGDVMSILWNWMRGLVVWGVGRGVMSRPMMRVEGEEVE